MFEIRSAVSRFGAKTSHWGGPPPKNQNPLVDSLTLQKGIYRGLRDSQIVVSIGTIVSAKRIRSVQDLT